MIPGVVVVVVRNAKGSRFRRYPTLGFFELLDAQLDGRFGNLFFKRVSPTGTAYSLQHPCPSRGDERDKRILFILAPLAVINPMIRKNDRR